MLKKLLAMLFSVVMVLGMGTITFAANASGVSDNKGKETITEYELIDHLNSTDFGRDITFTALPQSKLSDQELLKFDSVEDAEAYLKKFIRESSKLTMPSKSSMQNSISKQLNDNAFLRSSSGWYNSEVWWWGGGDTSLLGITHAEVKFSYDGSDISNITVTNSYMTGVIAAKWTHRRGSATALGGKEYSHLYGQELY